MTSPVRCLNISCLQIGWPRGHDFRGELPARVLGVYQTHKVTNVMMLPASRVLLFDAAHDHHVNSSLSKHCSRLPGRQADLREIPCQGLHVETKIRYVANRKRTGCTRLPTRSRSGPQSSKIRLSLGHREHDFPPASATRLDRLLRANAPAESLALLPRCARCALR